MKDTAAAPASTTGPRDALRPVCVPDALQIPATRLLRGPCCTEAEEIPSLIRLQVSVHHR